MLKMMEAVIFDLDGTLVDSMWIWRDIDIAYLNKFNICLPENLQSEIEGMSFTETAQYFKDKFQIPDSIEKMKDDWNEMAWEKYSTEVPMKPGAIEFLKYCKRNHIKMGIATSNSVELVQNIARVHGLHDYFSVIKTSCDAKKGKPAPDIYLLVAKELQVNPSNCLVFEDIIPGILAGKAAGMKVCAIEDEYSNHQAEEKHNLSDFYIKDYYQLLELLSLNSNKGEQSE